MKIREIDIVIGSERDGVNQRRGLANAGRKRTGMNGTLLIDQIDQDESNVAWDVA